MQHPDVLQPDRNRPILVGIGHHIHTFATPGLVSVASWVDPCSTPTCLPFSESSVAESANLWRQSNENLRRTTCRESNLLLTFIGNGERRNNGVIFFAFSEGISASKSLATQVHSPASVCTSRYRDRYQSQQNPFSIFRRERRIGGIGSDTYRSGSAA